LNRNGIISIEEQQGAQHKEARVYRTIALLALLALPSGLLADTTAVARVLAVSGGQQVKIVWFQNQDWHGKDWAGDGGYNKLVGFDTHGGGERFILSSTNSYRKPLLTHDASRIVFTNDVNWTLPDGNTYVVNWDGTGMRKVTAGFGVCTWKSPTNGHDYVFVMRANKAVYRYQIDDTTDQALVYTQQLPANSIIGTTSPHVRAYLQVSADGTRAADQFGGWPNVGLAVLSGGTYGLFPTTGCEISMTRDNSYRVLHRNIDHFSVTVYDSGSIQATHHRINLTGIGLTHDIDMAKWTNNNSYITLCAYGKEVSDNNDHNHAQVYFGHINDRDTFLLAATQVSVDTAFANWQADGWIGDTSTVVQPDTPVINLAPTSIGFGLKPADTAGTSQTVAVSNAGKGTLQTVTTSVQYARGTGWLAVTVGGSGNNQTLVNKVTIAGMDTGSYQATVTVSAANAASEQYQVQLTIANPQQAGNTGMTVLAPNGGERFQVGQTIRIRWRMDTLGQAVLLYISPDDGQAWFVINSQHAVFLVDSNWGNYGWTIPATINGQSLVSTTCRVRVSEYLETTVTDESDSAFTIGAASAIAATADAPAGAGLRAWRASDELCLRANAAGQAAIFDAAGRCIRAFSVPAGTVRVHGLRPGSYVVRLRSGSSTLTTTVCF
jgi:hypothetical protein